MLLTVKNALREIGLSSKEAVVLAALLERGPMYAASVAKAANINRTTTYGVLNELSARGLVSTIKQRGADMWQSIEPELLPEFIERRGKEILNAKSAVEEALPQIQLLRRKGSVLPKVRFFEGEEGIKQAYEDKLQNNWGKTLHEFTGMDAGYRKMDKVWIEYFTTKRARMDIRAEYITPDTPLARENAKHDAKLKRAARFIPQIYGMETEISIYDDKISFTSFSNENPVSVLIEDGPIARTMKKLFDYIDSTLEANRGE